MSTYINLENLARYDYHAKNRSKGLYSDASAANWQKTSKAGSVACYPAPKTAMEPVVEFLFKETPPASGEKSPTNPSTIAGVTGINVQRVGKNLLFRANGTSSYYTLTRNSDGSLAVSGSGAILVAVTDCGAGTGGPYSSHILDLNKQYTLSVEIVSGTISNGQINLAQSSASQKVVVLPSSGKASISFTPSTSNFVDGRFVCRLLTNNNSVATNAVLKIQLEEGNVATDFDPPILPADANYAIPLGATFYGGILDVATGKLTVTHTMYDIGASITNYSASNELFYFDAPKVVLSTLPTCESFIYHAQTGVLADLPDGQFMPHIAPDPSTQTRWIFRSSSHSSVEAFQEVFSGKKLVYQLNNPYTVYIDPVQILSLPALDKHSYRINTIYTDAEAVQVGYQKHPLKTEEDINNAILSLGGNI